MIKAVVFDCFGVLVQDAWFPFLDAYVGNDSDARSQAAYELRRVGMGAVSYEQFYDTLAEMTGVSSQIIQSELRKNPINKDLFEYMQSTLKPSYKIAMLSNAGSDRVQELFGDEYARLFDTTVLSYRVGMVKPDPAIYEYTAQQMELPPEECLFVDDQERYCRGAEEVGMKSVLFKDTSTAIKEIEELLHA